MDIFQSRAKAFFKKSRADSFLIFSDGGVKPVNPNFLYFSGAEIDGCAMLARRGESPVIFSGEMNFAYADETLGARFEVVKFRRRRFFAELRRHMKGVRKLGLDYGSTSIARFNSIRRSARKRTADVSDDFLSVRAQKDAGEIAKIKKAASIVREILSCAKITRGKTEQQLARELISAALERGCVPSFSPIVSSGARTAFPHSSPTKKKLDKCVMIDYGVKYEGYCSDMTRCFFLGRCAEEKAAYGKVKAVHDAALRAVSKGKAGAALFRLANSLLEKKKLPPLIHGLGHGIGLEVHEKPSLSSKSRDRILRNSVFTIEPGAYFPGKFGVRYENVAHCAGRARVL
jgi:Xaa-Pro aminopeptidase